jgi:hypothetical protein
VALRRAQEISRILDAQKGNNPAAVFAGVGAAVGTKEFGKAVKNILALVG